MSERVRAGVRVRVGAGEGEGEGESAGAGAGEGAAVRVRAGAGVGVGEGEGAAVRVRVRVKARVRVRSRVRVSGAVRSRLESVSSSEAGAKAPPWMPPASAGPATLCLYEPHMTAWTATVATVSPSPGVTASSSPFPEGKEGVASSSSLLAPRRVEARRDPKALQLSSAFQARVRFGLGLGLGLG